MTYSVTAVKRVEKGAKVREKGLIPALNIS